MMKVREMGGEITENSGCQYRIGTLHQSCQILYLIPLDCDGKDAIP